MFAVQGSERDPVLFYHHYASKRPDDVNKDSPFYLAINHTKNPASGKPWFKSAPMGVNKLNSLLKTMAQKAELDMSNLFNHSARKRMIQKLSKQNVPPTHIMQVSGHKNVQSINNYSLPVQQQREIKYSYCYGANQFSYQQGNIQQNDCGRSEPDEKRRRHYFTESDSE